MKKKSPPYAIIGAALLGLVAIFALFKYKQNQDAIAAANLAKVQADAAAALAAAQAQQAPVVQAAPTNMRNVYYATQPVEAGAKISSAFYEKKLTPNDILPDAYSEQSDIVGFYAIRNIEKGDPLTPRNIGRSLPYLSQRISPGMRAVALDIFNGPEANKTGGFVVDDDRVDLFFTTTAKDPVSGESFLIRTQLLMQNLKVLYVPGPKIESEQMNGIGPAPAPGGAISITFEVTPEQAQALIFLTQAKAEEGGSFSMVLKSRADKGLIKIKSFDAVDYVGNLKKVQTMTDKSEIRVQALADKIAAEQKLQQSAAPAGTTNETPNPTPPSP